MTRKFILIMDGENLAGNMDGSDQDENFKGYVNAFHSLGYTIKQVSQEEYKQAIHKQEQMIWDRDEEVLGNKR